MTGVYLRTIFIHLGAVLAHLAHLGSQVVGVKGSYKAQYLLTGVVHTAGRKPDRIKAGDVFEHMEM